MPRATHRAATAATDSDRTRAAPVIEPTSVHGPEVRAVVDQVAWPLDAAILRRGTEDEQRPPQSQCLPALVDRAVGALREIADAASIQSYPWTESEIRDCQT